MTIWTGNKDEQVDLFLIWANPSLFFVYFPFSLKVESNSDRTDPSWPLYPLDQTATPAHEEVNHLITDLTLSQFVKCHLVKSQSL